MLYYGAGFSVGCHIIPFADAYCGSVVDSFEQCTADMSLIVKLITCQNKNFDLTS